MLRGKRYSRKFRIECEHKESARDAAARQMAEIDRMVREGDLHHVIGKQVDEGLNNMEVIFEGPYDQSGTVVVPLYYFMFREYSPMDHRLGDLEVLMRAEPWPRIREKWHKYHTKLYHKFLSFEETLNALKLNDLITDEVRERVKVHYNFLSNFVHLTNVGLGRMVGRITVSIIEAIDDIRRYDHYMAELSLLYTIKMLGLYLKTLLEYFENKYSISGVAEFKDYLSKIDEEYRYFWFIYDEPSEYDVWWFETQHKPLYKLSVG